MIDLRTEHYVSVNREDNNEVKDLMRQYARQWYVRRGDAAEDIFVFISGPLDYMRILNGIRKIKKKRSEMKVVYIEGWL